MKIEELKTLTNKILDTNKNCHVDLDVWYPTVEDIKGLLKLGHDKINPNSNQKDVTIFNIEFDDYGSSKSPAFRITIFCMTLKLSLCVSIMKAKH